MQVDEQGGVALAVVSSGQTRPDETTATNRSPERRAEKKKVCVRVKVIKYIGRMTQSQ